MDNLKSMIRIWISLANNCYTNGTDIDTFERRAISEGRQFLFIELTTLGRDVNKALITGERLLITARFGLKCDTQKPEFLYDLFNEIFEDDGTLRSLVDPTYIKQLRQLTLLCYKTEVPIDGKRSSTAYSEFVTRDRSCGLTTLPSSCLKGARGRIGRVLSGLDPKDIIPRHGSGATACGTPNHDKYYEFDYYPRLNAQYEYSEYFFYSPSHLCDELYKLSESTEVREPCSKLVAIPKDMRGPRLICTEPKEMQFIQQGLMRSLYKRIESHDETRGFVNFTNQETNRELAGWASLGWISLATLDLKDASDLVSWDLVCKLFPSNWVVAIDSCRTRFVQIPGGGTYGPLRKCASMGSALCFPVEALVFWALLTSHLKTDVWVYGDDIILDKRLVKQATDVLEAVGLKVNTDKSCYETPFRESCGGDYYNGFDVSYVKLRREPIGDIESEVSLVEFANQINKHYGEDAASGIRDIVDGLYGPHFYIPTPTPLCYQGEHRSSNDVFFKRRVNSDHQTIEYLLRSVEVPVNKEHEDQPTQWAELLRATCVRDKDHFRIGHYAVAGCTQKYRWRTVSRPLSELLEANRKSWRPGRSLRRAAQPHDRV